MKKELSEGLPVTVVAWMSKFIEVKIKPLQAAMRAYVTVIMGVVSLMVLLPNVTQEASAAVAILDQSYEPSNFLGGLEVTNNQTVAQSFTVALSGRLSKIDIVGVGHHRCIASANLRVDLAPIINGVPGPSRLARVIVPADSIPGVPGASYLVAVDFDYWDVRVSTGDVLAVILSSDAPAGGCTYAWEGDTSGSYSGGSTYFFHANGTSWYKNDIRDMGFRTFVAQAREMHVGGSVRGIGAGRVVCKNFTTGQTVIAQPSHRSWDCEAAGLVVNYGDVIRQITTATYK